MSTSIGQRAFVLLIGVLLVLGFGGARAAGTAADATSGPLAIVAAAPAPGLVVAPAAVDATAAADGACVGCHDESQRTACPGSAACSAPCGSAVFALLSPPRVVASQSARAHPIPRAGVPRSRSVVPELRPPRMTPVV